MQSRHGSLESAILSTLWQLEQNGTCTNSVKDVHDALCQTNDEKKAYTTIKTVMDRLFEKKVLDRYKKGKKFCYRTLYSNNEAIAQSLLGIAQRYCNGDLAKLSPVLSSLIKENMTA